MVATLNTRRNHWNDLYYRDDPTIMGWELANEPHMPGDDTGNVLKARLLRVELPCSWEPHQPGDCQRAVRRYCRPNSGRPHSRLLCL